MCCSKDRSYTAVRHVNLQFIAIRFFWRLGFHITPVYLHFMGFAARKGREEERCKFRPTFKPPSAISDFVKMKYMAWAEPPKNAKRCSPVSTKRKRRVHPHGTLLACVTTVGRLLTPFWHRAVAFASCYGRKRAKCNISIRRNITSDSNGFWRAVGWPHLSFAMQGKTIWKSFVKNV